MPVGRGAVAVLAALLPMLAMAQAPKSPTELAAEGGSGGDVSQAEMDADFARRAAQSGNIWANNFTEIYEGGAPNQARSISSTEDIRNDSAAMGIGPGAANFRDTATHLSGTGSVDVQTYDTTTRGDGSYNAQMNGRDGTVIDSVYVQFSVYYPRETIAWRYPIASSTAFKIVNFGDYGGGQFVLAIDRFMGFPAGFINGSQNLSQAVGSTFSGTPWGNVTHIQNAIDTGSPANPRTKAQWLQRYGYLLGGLEDDMSWGENDEGTRYLDERDHAGFGWPDSRAASAGVPIEVDGWTTFEVFIDRGAGTLKIWAAPYWGAPTLIWEGVGNVPFGSGSDVNELYLLNYDTQRQAEPGIRPSLQHTYFDELIVSREPIDFPGGHTLP